MPRRTLMAVFENRPGPTLGERLAAALDALCLSSEEAPSGLIGINDLGRRLGLSAGYLGQCRPSAKNPRRPTRHLVLLLEMLVRHPEDLDKIAD